jgi:hypothetical protein
MAKSVGPETGLAAFFTFFVFVTLFAFADVAFLDFFVAPFVLAFIALEDFAFFFARFATFFAFDFFFDCFTLRAIIRTPD